MRYSANVRQAVTDIAESEIERIGSVALMQCEPDIVMAFPRLLKTIQEECRGELDAVEASDHPRLLQSFAAEAGYLVGLEMGKRMAQGGAR